MFLLMAARYSNIFYIKIISDNLFFFLNYDTVNSEEYQNISLKAKFSLASQESVILAKIQIYK